MISSDTIYGALRDLVPFVQFKKSEKNPWRNVNFSKAEACNSAKINTPPWVFFMFFKWYKWTKSRKASHILLYNILLLLYLNPFEAIFYKVIISKLIHSVISLGTNTCSKSKLKAIEQNHRTLF